MPIIISENYKNTNKKKDKVGGGGMDIAKTKKKKKPVPKSLKNVMNKKIKDAEKKDSTFGMLMTSANYPELFERTTKKFFGGGKVGMKSGPAPSNRLY